MDDHSAYKLRNQPRVVINTLQPAATENEYRTHFTALEWSLAEPILIRDEQDIQSRPNWQDRIQPFRHQIENLVRFCRRLPVSLIADDVGLGKTISAGLIISELMIRRRINRVLIIAPKILVNNWCEELQSKFGIRAKELLSKNFHSIQNENVLAHVITYNSARQILPHIRPGTFDMVVLDEAHAIRNLRASVNPPIIAQEIYRSLESRMFKYVLMLTATPIQNRLWDIYSLVDCLAVAKGHRNPLGSRDEFAARYVADGKAAARELKPEFRDEFRSIVANYMLRTRRADAKLLFPERDVKNLEVRSLTEEKLLQQLVANEVSGLDPLVQSSLLVGMMSSPHALAKQISKTGLRGVVAKHLRNALDTASATDYIPAKMSKLLEIVQELKHADPNWRIVIFTSRLETQEMIARVFSRQGIRFGLIRGSSAAANQRAISDFRQDPPRIQAIISSDAGAEGVNLQVANVLVNYDLPWNPMVVEQRIGRIQRIGSNFSRVVIFNLVHSDSPESRIVGRLMQKLQVIAHTVGDIEALLNQGDGQDRGESFEASIRKLVINSLQGFDVEKQTMLAEKSIEEGRRIFDENIETIDRTLGALEQGVDEIPSPKLEKSPPRTGYREFVVDALRNEEIELQELSRDLYQTRSSQYQDGLLAFNEAICEQHSASGVFQGRTPALYVPGKPAFERLVQKWVDRSATRLFSAEMNETQIQQTIQQWVASIPGAVLRNTATTAKPKAFVGEVICRAKIANNVDSFEKLIAIQAGGDFEFHEPSEEQATRIVFPTKPDSLIPDLASRIAGAVQADKDIRKFEEFYDRRLQVERRKSDQGARLESLERDLASNVFAEPLATRGVVTSVIQAEVVFDLPNKSGVTVSLELANNQVTFEPVRATCRHSFVSVPSPCLETCEESGNQIMPEYVETCSVSGKRVWRNLLHTCPESSKHFLPNEGAVCSVSNLLVLPSLLEKSEHSGRSALGRYIQQCEFTEKIVLVDEIVYSSLSNRKLIKDHAINLADGRNICHPKEAFLCDFNQLYYPIHQEVISEYSNKRSSIQSMARSDVSGVLVHQSELKACEVTSKQLLPSEGETCSVSGKWVIANELAVCPQTDRKLLREYLAICDETGTNVHPSALSTCCLTNKKVLKNLLGKSDESGRMALQSCCLKCPETDKQVLTDEVVLCEDSGELVVRSSLGYCEVTGKQVRLSRLHRSPISKKLACRYLFQSCEETNELMLPEDLEVCQETQRTVDKRLVAESSFSKRRVLKRLLKKSFISHRYGIESELAQCGETQKRLLLDELGICEFTQKRVNKNLLISSDLSGKQILKSRAVRSERSSRIGAPNELKRCEITHRWYCPDEGDVCEVSGRWVHGDLLGESQISGKRVAKVELRRSHRSNRFALETEMLRCELTGNLLFPDEVGLCSISNQTIDRKMLVQSDLSEKLALVDHMVVSERSGKRGLPSEMIECEETTKWFLPHEIGRCEITSKRVDPSLVGIDSRSGKPVLLDLLATSPISNVCTLKSAMVRCVDTQKYYLPDEVDRCSESQEFVEKSLLEEDPATGKKTRSSRMGVSALSGKREFKHLMVKCQETHEYFLEDEVGKCEASGGIVDRRLLGYCAISKKTCLNRLLVTSELTGRNGRLIFLRRCGETGKTLFEDESIQCEVSKEFCDPSMILVCSITGKKAGKSRMVRCSLTGRWGLASQSLKSADGRVFLNDAITKCYWNGKYHSSSMVAECVLTGCKMSAGLLSPQKEFQLLIKMLTGEEQGESLHDLSVIMDAVPSELVGLKEVRVTSNSKGDKHAVVGRRSSFLMFNEWIGFLCEGSKGSCKLGSNIAVGKRVADSWIIQKVIVKPQP